MTSLITMSYSLLFSINSPRHTSYVIYILTLIRNIYTPLIVICRFHVLCYILCIVSYTLCCIFYISYYVFHILQSILYVPYTLFYSGFYVLNSILARRYNWCLVFKYYNFPLSRSSW